MKRRLDEEDARPDPTPTAAAGPAAIEADVRETASVAAAERKLSSPKEDGHWRRAEAMIPLAGLIVTVGLAFISRYDNRESLRRQLQNQAAIAENQRKLSEAQLAAALLASIVKGSAEERRSALSILSSAAPLHAKQISAALLSSGVPPDKTDMSQAFIQQIEQKSDDNDRMQQFKQHLQNARKYRDYGQFNAAGLEYSQAYENTPPAWTTSIANGVAEAKALYDRGEFEEADRKFEEELSKVSP
jgi:hypothetical protein